jgi:hypothetical protein
MASPGQEAAPSAVPTTTPPEGVPTSGAAAPLQRIVFAVAGPIRGEISEVQVTWRRAGTDRTLRLVDDGSDVADAPWDGVWMATDTGVYVRDGSVSITVTDLDGREHAVFSGVVHPRDATASVLAWQLYEAPDGLRAHEVPAAWPGATLVIPEAVDVYVGAAWACFVCALVAGLVHAARREGIGW